ncbi:VOC family protein [Sphingobium sp. LB126]|uniref:VOC family protein n=1 Tax=Sphingobium sp. LB126 TaxID=1983755 RepID=UPI000C202B10|nr:VOC family protein [Sphingobium sp. LB126]
MKVDQLGYLAFDFPSAAMADMRTLFQHVIGADVVDGEDGSVRVRLDGRAFRIDMRQQDGLESGYRVAAVGWEVADGPALDALVARVRARGIEVTQGDAAACEARSAAALVRFTDPFGFPVEFFVDRPFGTDERLSTRFVCGSTDRGKFGLGHVVQITHDHLAALDFYRDVLGFGFSDRITWDAADLFFLHCNKRHHSVALGGEIFGMKSGQIDHFMIEATAREYVDEAYAKLKEHGFAVSQTLGQHTNDDVYSFYLMAPVGFRVEFGFGGNIVDDPEHWVAKQYDSPSRWGHELMHP